MRITNALLTDALGTRPGEVLLQHGVIAAVGESVQAHPACAQNEPVLDAQGLVLMPAFVDLHCHFRTPGFTHKEDVESGSRAAVRGGYTFVNCMANTKPVCSSAAIAQSVMDEARRIGLCDVNQCISITKEFDGKTLEHLQALPRNLRCISDDGRGVQSNDVMWRAMQIAAQKGLTVMSHAEDMDISPKDYRLAENIETARNLLLAQTTGAKLHLCHVSTKEAIAYLAKAKQAGVPVTCEVAPHHLYFAGKEAAGYRVNPPIRAQEDVQALLEAIRAGTVDAIATDHAPHTPEEKQNGAPGMVGLETAFAVCNTVLCHREGMPLSVLSGLMSRNPARILGLRKGLLQEGMDADLVLLDPSAEVTVCADDFAGKSHNTPFDGHTLRGEVCATLKAGKLVYRNPARPL